MPSDTSNQTLQSMRGTEKAAMLLLALGEEHSMSLFSLMDDDEIKDISQVMSTLGTVQSSIVNVLLVEFVDTMSATGGLVGSFESTERLLSKVLGDDRVSNIMEEIRGPAGRTMWDKLGNVSEAVLANYLKNEYPQTVAVVLTKINTEHAARVLAALPDGLALEVIMRMLRMESVQKDVLEDVESTLRSEFMSNLARTSRRDSHEHMAELFNSLDRNTEQRFLTALEERNRDAAERVKALMFTFDDLAKLDPASVQTLLRKVDKVRLPMALKGATAEMRDFFFSNMSERGAKLMRGDLEDMGPARLRDVDEAQAYIVNMAKELAAQGEIMIADTKGDDELIY